MLTVASRSTDTARLKFSNIKNDFLSFCLHFWQMEQSESFKHDPCCFVLPFMTVLVLRVWHTLHVVCSSLLQGEPWQPILCLHSFEITTILKNYHGPWSTAWYDAKNDEEKILKDSSERCGGKRGYGDKGAFKRFKGRSSQSNLQKIKIKLYPFILSF